MLTGDIWTGRFYITDGTGILHDAASLPIGTQPHPEYPVKVYIGRRSYTDALKSGVDTAYKAVMKPREGTILTVSRAFAEEAARQAAGLGVQQSAGKPAQP